MTDRLDHPLDILLVDDDQENLDQLRQLVPNRVRNHNVSWEFEVDFDSALERLKIRRYDLLISDIYRDRQSFHKNIDEGDIRARDLVAELREHRFCPVILFTDGQVPGNLVSHPFVLAIDKAGTRFMDELLESVCCVLDTGIPSVARKLHDELDRSGSSYIWSFLIENWDKLNGQPGYNLAALERVLRRRAAVQLGRTEGVSDPPTERGYVEACDYYLYPPLGESYRLGSVVRRKQDGEFRVVLTPHCFLTVQPGQEKPRADSVLTVRTVAASELIAGTKEWPKKEGKIPEALRKRTSVPASDVGSPEGRYCFLPGFMEIPDLYCDLMALESVPYESLHNDFEQIAVLDTPFAEALQAAFGRLYGSVGLPLLDTETLKHLGPEQGI